ncbi:MAG: hypothetical protein HN380_23575 [Victivallales bacterium]|nr:hypothetical protein [Victivallales bacterium]
MRCWSERPRTALLLTLIVVGMGVQAQENVASGAAVTFVIPPNYAYSKHPDDARHLTDGLPTPARGRYQAWTAPGAVGWSHRNAAFILDLGAEKRIGSFVVRSKHCERVGVLPPQSLRAYAVRPRQLLLVGEAKTSEGMLFPPVVAGEDAGPTRSVINTLPVSSRKWLICIGPGKNMSVDEIEAYEHADPEAPPPAFATPLAFGIPEVYEPLLGTPVNVQEVLTKARVISALQCARPLATGSAAATFVLPAASVRDAVELTARSDLTAQVVPFYYQRALDPAAVVRIEERLSGETPLWILGGLSWPELDASVRDLLLAGVRAGRFGVLWVHCHGTPPVTLPDDATPTDALGHILSQTADSLPPKTTVKAHRLGQGRFATLRYAGGNKVPPTTLFPAITPAPDAVGIPRWEGCAATLIRTALWAAGRLDPTLDLSLAGSAVQVRHEAREDTNLIVNWYDRFWEPLGVRQVKATGGTSTIPFPQLPSGRHACVVSLVDGQDRVMDWAMVAVPGPDNVRITALSAEPSPLEPGKPNLIRVQIEAKRPIDASRVQIRVLDAWGRLLTAPTATVTVPVGVSTVLVPVEGLERSPRAVGLLLDATVTAGPELLHRTRRHVPVRQQRKPSFFFEEWSGMSWWGSATPAGLAMTAEELRMGVDSATFYGVGEPTIRARLAANVRANPLGFGRVTVKSTELRDRIRKPCLADPEYVEKLSSRMLDMVATSTITQPDVVISGDEQSIGYWSWGHDLDWSPLSLQRFRMWLRSRWGGLPELNAAWQTKFARWEDVMPIPLAEARERDVIAPWLEFRRFMDSEFIGLFEGLSGRLRQKHPNVRVGLSGMAGPSAFNGHDFKALLDRLPVAPIIYDGLQRELVRGWRGDDDRVSTWTGYDTTNTNERYDRFHPWYMLAHGCDGANAYTSWQFSYRPYADGGMISVNGYATAHGEWIAEEIASIRSGPAALLKASKRLHPDIAVLFSMESLNAATCRKWARYSQVVYGVTQAIEDLGFQYDMLAPEQLTTKALKPYRLIILPAAYCLGDKQIQALRAAARNGAVLLTDWRAGSFDQHGVPRTPGFAEQMLGRPPAAAPPQWTPETLPQIVDIGAGRADLIESVMPEYAWFQLKGAAPETEQQLDPTNTDTRRAWRTQLATLITDAGCTYGPKLQSAGTTHQDVEKVVYQNGDQVLALLLRKYTARGSVGDGTPRSYGLVVPKQAPFAYLGRTGRFLGKGSVARIDLRPSDVALVSFLPYRVNRLAIARMASPSLPRFRATVETGGRGPGRHIIHVRVTAPDGTPVPAADQTVEARQGTAEFAVPAALNDPPGLYTVHIRDAATGITATTTHTR